MPQEKWRVSVLPVVLVSAAAGHLEYVRPGRTPALLRKEESWADADRSLPVVGWRKVVSQSSLAVVLQSHVISNNAKHPQVLSESL